MESNEGQQQKKLDENQPKVTLGFSESKKNVGPKRPRTREITSRFMCSNGSSSSSNVGAPVSSSAARCPSPIGSRSPDLHPKRPQPGLRRQGTPYPTESRAPSTDGHRRPGPDALRSLSMSMQYDNFNSDHPLKPSSGVINQVDTTGDGSSSREETPEKKRPVVQLFRDIGGDQYENARPLDNVLPKPRSVKPQTHPMSRSVNNNMEKIIRGGQARGRTPKTNPFSRSVSGVIGDGVTMAFNAPRPIPFDGRGRSALLKGSGMHTEDPNQNSQSPPRSVCNDGIVGTVDRSSSPESTSSDSASRARNGTRRSQEVVHGVVVPARFLQDVNNRSRASTDVRHSMSEAELIPSTSGRGRGAGKLSKSSNQALPPTPSNSGAILTSGPQATVSPVKIISGASSPSRCLPSPTRARGQGLLPPAPTCQSVRSSVTGTLINFGADTKKGKKGTNQVEDAHLLRILHNRYLQWRFVNAKAEVVMNTQKSTAEKMLYNMWKTTSELQDSVTLKRIELQKERQVHKLKSVLSGQKSYLEDWALLEEDHVSVLSEAITNLQAATLRVPITDGIQANIPEVKEGLTSAVNVMDAMSSSIRELLPKVEGTSTLVSELATVAAQEKALLDECAELLATTGELEFEEASLRTQLIQLKRDKSKGIG